MRPFERNCWDRSRYARRSAAAAILIAMSGGATEARSATAPQADAIRVRELSGTTGSRSTPFGVISGMLEVSPGVVVISDEVVPMLHRWELESGSVRPLAGEGDGPGEVETPTLLARSSEGGFALYDIGHAAIQWYSATGSSVGRTPVGRFVSNPKALLVFEDGGFLLTGGQLSDDRSLHRFSPEGAWLESWGDPFEPDGSIQTRVQTAGGPVSMLPGGGFLFARSAPLEIHRFRGPALRDPELLTTDPDLVPGMTTERFEVPMEEGRLRLRWYFDQSTGLFALADGRILHVVTRVYSGDSIWELYEADGTRIARTLVDRSYRAWALTSDDRVIASYRDSVTDESVAVVLAWEPSPVAPNVLGPRSPR